MSVRSLFCCCLAPSIGARPKKPGSFPRSALDARAGEARGAGFRPGLAQIADPKPRHTAAVNAELPSRRARRPAGQRDRLAEAARNEIAAAGPDCADEADRGAAF